MHDHRPSPLPYPRKGEGIWVLPDTQFNLLSSMGNHPQNEKNGGRLTIYYVHSLILLQHHVNDLLARIDYHDGEQEQKITR